MGTSLQIGIMEEKERRFYGCINAILAVVHMCSLLFLLFIHPFLSEQAGWFLLAGALLANSYWALLHEAIHGHLLEGTRRNRRVGRVMAILLGSSYRLLRFGHLTHHRYNRHPLDCPEFYNSKAGHKGKFYIRYYIELFFGIYFVEVILPILFLLPRSVIFRLLRKIYSGKDKRITTIRILAEQQLGKKAGIWEIRQDALIHVVLIITALLVWNSNWIFIPGFYLLRGFLLSFTDNIYHFGTSPLDSDYAYNLALPKFLQLGIFNMNMHRVHHRHMDLPWWVLPAQFSQDKERFDYPFGQWPCAN